MDGLPPAVARALRYPFARPTGSVLVGAAETLAIATLGDVAGDVFVETADGRRSLAALGSWPAGERFPDGRGRTPVLAVGANAAPAVLRAKLAGVEGAGAPVPLLAGRLSGFDVVYSAHVSPHGAISATLQRSPGTSVAVHVTYLDAAQRAAVDATEPNYRREPLSPTALALASGAKLTEVEAYVSRHGCLCFEGTEIALAAVPADGRVFPALSEPQVLALARTQLAPDLRLEDFVSEQLRDPAVAARRTRELRRFAAPLAEGDRAPAGSRSGRRARG